MTSLQRSLPFDHPLHLEAHRFLVDEAAIMDAQLWADWLELLTDDIRYLMPVRVTTSIGTGFDTQPGMAHFDENRYTLGKRVERLLTEHAWTEDPPSRTRHLITNVRTLETSDDVSIDVESTVLLFRSRGDDREPELLCAHRNDRLRRGEDGWRLDARHITVEEAVLRTQNLAILL